ncbi:MAG: YHYH domain-containing protein [Halieaceae bacterium]|nr:YHYH domain-containing protein [Halieaceae bacterium]
MPVLKITRPGFRSRFRNTRLVLAIVLVSLAPWLSAHPGALNTSDCHNNRSNGDYHCHRQKQAVGSKKDVFIPDIQGRVISVIDGDTIKVLDGQKIAHKIRLNGIDAPERDQPWGIRSQKYLASMVAGKQVLVRSVKFDKYERILGNVWAAPGDCLNCGKTLYINHAQVLAGMAWWYRYYAQDQSVEDRSLFEAAEVKARVEKQGLWGDPKPVPPWAWRWR